jgi:hypothetical protein
MEETQFGKQKSKVCWWCIQNESEDTSLRPMDSFCAETEAEFLDYCIGEFCSFECCLAYMKLHRFNQKCISDLMNVFRNKHGHESFLYAALAPQVLADPFGGSMSLQEYRKCYHSSSNIPQGQSHISTKHMLDIILKPYVAKKEKLEQIYNDIGTSSSQ